MRVSVCECACVSVCVSCVLMTMCVYECASRGTRGKIQNGGFFRPKSVEKLPFCQKYSYLKVFD